jgi:excisionase family DNA binding protein
MQPCANAGSVSDEKSKNVQSHAGSSKDIAGSLLYRLPTDSEVLRSGRPLLTVRQVAKLLEVCSATVYRLCGRGELPHFPLLNAIRIDPRTVKRFLAQSRRRGLPVRPKALY